MAFTDPPPCSESPCLFNIKTDPSEAHDLAKEEPAKLGELMARYDELRKSEVSAEEARLCPGPFRDGCRANLRTGVWAPWVDV